MAAARATDLRLRRLFISSSDPQFDCRPDFKLIFDEYLVLVARFNFIRKSFVNTAASFHNGI